MKGDDPKAEQDGGVVAFYWMGPAIAHLFLTFGFGDDHLAISIEARKDRTKP